MSGRELLALSGERGGSFFRYTLREGLGWQDDRTIPLEEAGRDYEYCGVAFLCALDREGGDPPLVLLSGGWPCSDSI